MKKTAANRFLSCRIGPALVCLAVAVALTVPSTAAFARKKAVPDHAAAPKSSENVDVPGKVITEPNAFHGVKWGTSLAAVPGLTVVERSGRAVYASHPNVAYRIGDAFLSNVVYGFCQDKFAAVLMEFRGRPAYESIKKLLAAKYTKPMELNDNPDNLAWPLGGVLIRMEFDAAKNAGALSYFYQPLYAPCTDAGKAAKP